MIEIIVLAKLRTYEPSRILAGLISITENNPILFSSERVNHSSSEVVSTILADTLNTLRLSRLILDLTVKVKC